MARQQPAPLSAPAQARRRSASLPPPVSKRRAGDSADRSRGYLDYLNVLRRLWFPYSFNTPCLTRISSIENCSRPPRDYLAIAVLAASIFAFTESRLKLAPLCMGGNSMAVIASFSTCCWTNTKRQNSYLNQSKYCCAPSLVPLFGHPVRSKGSRRRLIRYGTSGLVLSPSQPPGWSMKRYLESSMRTAPNSLSPKYQISCRFDGP